MSHTPTLAAAVQDSSSYARAMLNILDDVAEDGVRLRQTQTAVLNILEDAAAEKTQLQQVQRAVLNILEDVDLERSDRHRAEEEVRALNADLEARVAQRTAALTAANQELESFAYSVSHDLRAPLRAIDGFSQVLLDDYAAKLDGEGQQALNRVRDATQRMGHLIDDMLKLSRATRSQMTLGAVDLSAIARKVVDEITAGNPREHMTVEIADGIVALGDAGLVRNLLENLLSNAWKFTGKIEAPHIEFGAEHRDGEVICFVRDNGAGFDMAYAEKLFTPFHRLHLPTDFPGNGVGLATVKRIVTRLGGRTWAQSTIDSGATFYFTLREAGSDQRG